MSLGLSLPRGLHHVGVTGVHLTHLDAQKQGHIFLKAIELSGWRLKALNNGLQGNAEGVAIAAQYSVIYSSWLNLLRES